MKKCSFLTVLACVILAATLVVSGCGSVDSGTEAPSPKIMRPYISEQPESHSYHIDSYEAAPELKATIKEWNKADGELSYQWFKFTSIDEYFKNEGGEPVGAEPTVIDYTNPAVFVVDEEGPSNIGDITLKYTPNNIPESPEDGKQYYYYVVLTNKRKSETAAVQSEIAAISFSAAGKPLYPIIVTNPAGADYEWGAAMNDLRVKAKKAPGSASTDQLSYQWRTKKLNAATNEYEDENIADENRDRLVIDYQKHGIKLNENIFLVAVTNTDASSNTKTAVSIPAILNIKPARRAAAPVITVQPQDKFYFIGETVAPLTVAGVSTDAGDISYQWYSNTANSNTGGTSISGATNASYTPSISTSKAANMFYYAVVTNTNNNVTSNNKTVSATSMQAKISIAASAANDAEANVYLTIADVRQSTNRFNYIRGYGGMDVAWGNFPRTTQADTELMYDPNKLGYNMLRIMIRADHTDPSQTIAELLAGDRPDYYENVKIVNKYGGYVLASPWTPPKEWKSNNSINGGGVLIPKYYPLFAEYLRKFAQNMADNGAPIYAISISNEPNYVAGYDGCEWTGEEAADFFVKQGHFTSIPTPIRGWGGGQETPFVLTMNGESANTPYFNNPALENAIAKGAIDVLARHIYGERSRSLWNDYPANLFREKGGENDNKIEVWMTEHNINSANATGYYNDSTWNYVWRFLNDVDLSMRLNNENAFVWWASKRFYSMVGDGQFGTPDGVVLPRGWALAHYSRFTIDMTRVNIGLTPGKSSKTQNNLEITAQGTMTNRPTEITYNVLNNNNDDMDNDRARITAYISRNQADGTPGSEISLVMWTPRNTKGSGGYGLGTVKVELPSYSATGGGTMKFKATGATAVRSFGDRQDRLFQPYDVKLSADRTAVYVDLPVSHIVSVKLTGEWVNE
jgi:O-glycosyl hydrolase